MHELKEYLSNFSTDGLKKMQKAVYDALAHEDSLPGSDPKPYGVRQYTDWKQWSNALEAELSARGEVFAKVPW